MIFVLILKNIKGGSLMIEVEIKCKPTTEQMAALLKDAKFISEEHLTDIYYDSSTYELSLKDFWLRTRNDKFVLKTPATTCPILAEQANTPKHELENEQEIRKALKLSSQGSLKEAIMLANYKPLYTLSKIRKKYTKNGFIIDVDHATFETLTFDLCEIETMVEKIEDIKQATQNLINFAKGYGITLKGIPGNLIALIQIINPTHFELLEKARAKRSK
jgi:predicted adenylyl cyclase CyaB